VIRDLPRLSRWAVLSGCAGNLVENFGGATFSYLAPLFAHQFFPLHTPSVALLLTLATYATGFLTKPVGAYIFGAYGDCVGRRDSLYLSILLMAVSSLIVTVVPGYSHIGFAAPVLLVVARLLEGISSGGEFGLSAAYLIEFAPARRRAFVGSLQQVTVIAGVLLGSAVVALLENTVPSAALHTWVWRLPFALGTVLCLACAVLRYWVSDTPLFEDVKNTGGQAAHPVWEVLRDYPQASLRVVGLSMAGIMAYYVWLKFLPSYAHASVGIDLATAQIVNVVALVITLPLIPLVGCLADRYGRRPMWPGCGGLPATARPARRNGRFRHRPGRRRGIAQLRYGRCAGGEGRTVSHPGARGGDLLPVLRGSGRVRRQRTAPDAVFRQLRSSTAAGRLRQRGLSGRLTGLLLHAGDQRPFAGRSRGHSVAKSTSELAVPSMLSPSTLVFTDAKRG
jgi:MFS family permease